MTIRGRVRGWGLESSVLVAVDIVVYCCGVNNMMLLLAVHSVHSVRVLVLLIMVLVYHCAEAWVATAVIRMVMVLVYHCAEAGLPQLYRARLVMVLV